jgi:plasmid stability protein
MAVLIQIREVPAAAHRTLKARAATEGRTLSDYLRRELVRLAESPTPEEIWERIGARAPIELSESPAEAIRRERDARG